MGMGLVLWGLLFEWGKQRSAWPGVGLEPRDTRRQREHGPRRVLLPRREPQQLLARQQRQQRGLSPREDSALVLAVQAVWGDGGTPVGIVPPISPWGFGGVAPNDVFFK